MIKKNLTLYFRICNFEECSRMQDFSRTYCSTRNVNIYKKFAECKNTRNIKQVKYLCFLPLTLLYLNKSTLQLPSPVNLYRKEGSQYEFRAMFWKLSNFKVIKGHKRSLYRSSRHQIIFTLV